MLPRLPALLTLLVTGSACSAPPEPAPGTPLPRRGDEIMVCGNLFHSGAPVVLWTDPGGYDAYRATRRFPRQDDPGPKEKQRYGVRTASEEITQRVAADGGWTLDTLRDTVRQFVIHYDVCGTSRQCAKVLERRDLSVHFMLDVDGTIYQTLDLKERAWHAGTANSASVGIEIAHIGAYPQPGYHTLNTWYPEDEHGRYIHFPKYISEPGVRTPDFVGRPARPDILSGTIHGATYYQYDFTAEQYASLTKLVATLHRVLPGIRLDAPRDDEGGVLMRALSDEERLAYSGILGHFHVSQRKTDPGPAFDWDGVLGGARALLDG